MLIVHWTDATISDEEHGTAESFVVGFLKAADEASVVLAMSVFDDADTRTHLTIPARMVNAISTLGTLQLQGDE